MDTADTSLAAIKETNGHMSRSSLEGVSKSPEELPDLVEGSTKEENSEKQKTTIEDDGVEYPHGLRLAIITVMVFLLVRTTSLTLAYRLLCVSRYCVSL